MPVVTGRRAIYEALRDPLSGLGWSARAAGWWTLGAAEGWTYVVTAGTASGGMQAGHARAALYVGARLDVIEAEVARLCNVADSYQTRTVTMNIGYTMPAHTWREWHVTEELAPSVAAEMAEAVHDHTLPFLGNLIRDPAAVLAETKKSRTHQSVGLARHILLSLRYRGAEDGLALVAEMREVLEHRSDPAAAEQRAVLEVLAERVS